MAGEAVRPVSGEELAEWRHRRRVVHTAERRDVPPEPATPPGGFRRATPGQVYERLRRQVLGQATKSRDDFRIMVQALRAQNPSLVAHLTDDQAIDILERDWDEKIKASIARTFDRVGRDKELRINLDGH